MASNNRLLGSGKEYVDNQIQGRMSMESSRVPRWMYHPVVARAGIIVKTEAELDQMEASGEWVKIPSPAEFEKAMAVLKSKEAKAQQEPGFGEPVASSAPTPTPMAEVVDSLPPNPVTIEDQEKAIEEGLEGSPEQENVGDGQDEDTTNITPNPNPATTFVCDQCGKTFPQQRFLSSHIAMVHKNPPQGDKIVKKRKR